MMTKDNHRLIDLSHVVESGMITYRGLPAPLICDYLSREASRASYAPGVTFQIAKIEMVANTGTYIDAPFHRYEVGQDLADLPLTALAHLEGILFHANPLDRAITSQLFANQELAGKAVLIHTDWDKHWRTDRYFENHPFLTRDAASCLQASGATLVGIDSYNVDDIADGARPVHSILLRAGIPIVEHLGNLAAIPDNGFTFSAVPVKFKGVGTFPVRAFALLEP